MSLELNCYSGTPGPTKVFTLDDTSPPVSATTLISFECHSGCLAATVVGRVGLPGVAD